VASTTSELVYAQPSQTLKETGTVLTTNMTTAVAITSGVAVSFNDTGPEKTSGRTETWTGGPTAYTNYLTTQLATSGATAGDTAEITLTLRYDES